MKRAFQYIRAHTGILVVCFIYFLVGLSNLNRVLVYTPDSARYLVWSQSLAHVEGFRDNTTPEPSKYVVHAPLYSLLIAPSAWISSENVLPAKLLTLCMGVLLLWAVYSWAKMHVEVWWAVLLCSLLAFNPTTVLYSTQVLSDIPFAFCVFLSIALLENKISGKSKGDSRLLALTASIVCGFFLREVGLALVIACAAILVARKYFKDAFLVLAVCVGFYLLWYIRNEVWVAGSEHPPLRNTQLFFRHFFTPGSVSLAGEFLERLKTNALMYGGNLLHLPFLSETILRGMSTMAPSQSPISLVLPVMPYIYHVFLILTLMVTLVGVYCEYGNKSRFFMLAVFLSIYLVPILLYPISDVRFLYPLLVIEFYLLVVGVRFVARSLSGKLRRPFIASWMAAMFCSLLALPNLGWVITYAENNWNYRRSSTEFYERMKGVPAYPTLFSKPFDIAGEWIAAHSDLSAVIISRWKEVALYTSGRKVMDVDPQTLVDAFEDMLRDYDVQYIVTVVSRGGLREYEQVFAQSKHYHFTVAKRFGDLEVVKIEKGKTAPGAVYGERDSAEDGIRVRFTKAIRALDGQKPRECESILEALPMPARRQVLVLLNLAVAKEFAGNLEVANTMFEQFHDIQQAGSIVQPASFHLEIISKLKIAEHSPSALERAQAFHAVAAYYWILGFHNQSLLMLDNSIHADSTFFPSLIFRGIYSLLNGDTLTSVQFLERAKNVEPSNSLVLGLRRIVENLKTLSRNRSRDVGIELRLDNARELKTMGLRENAIDELLRLTSAYPDNEQCLRLLVDLYYQKGRYAPALVYLKRLLRLHPEDVELQNEFRQLVSRW